MKSEILRENGKRERKKLEKFNSSILHVVNEKRLFLLNASQRVRIAYDLLTPSMHCAFATIVFIRDVKMKIIVNYLQCTPYDASQCIK